MSGGSYHYLHQQESPERHLLGQISKRLDELGYYVLANRTRAKIVEHDNPLRAAWKAVEWFDSNDWSARQTHKALEEAEGLLKALEDTGD